jgi:hypothetical protein
MSLVYKFLLTNKVGPKIPHLLELEYSERIARFSSWKYFRIQGKFVPQGQPPEASGNKVLFGVSQASFDLYTNSGNFATLNLNKSLNNLQVGDIGDFICFTLGSAEARFTGRERT